MWRDRVASGAQKKQSCGYIIIRKSNIRRAAPHFPHLLVKRNYCNALGAVFDEEFDYELFLGLQIVVVFFVAFESTCCPAVANDFEFAHGLGYICLVRFVESNIGSESFSMQVLGHVSKGFCSGQRKWSTPSR